MNHFKVASLKNFIYKNWIIYGSIESWLRKKQSNLLIKLWKSQTKTYQTNEILWNMIKSSKQLLKKSKA